jgi:hypothetical protein
MIKAISQLLPAIPLGVTQLLTLSVPTGRTYKILDIRVPFSGPAAALVTVAVDNDDRFILVGTDAENTYTINEDLPGPKTITARISDPVGSPIIAGITILYDDGEKA